MNDSQHNTKVIPFPGVREVCWKCQAPLSPSERYCLGCRSDNKAPNVRECQSEDESKALSKRFHSARDSAYDAGLEKEFKQFQSLIKSAAVVVVTLPARVALTIVTDPSTVYANYERLVSAQVRSPSSHQEDRRRSTVSAWLFGSYADRIIYGALALSGKGLPTYGEVHCCLRNSAIEDRTSFLETNSYTFAENKGISPLGKVPAGFRSDWSQRDLLVLAKLGSKLSPGLSSADLEQLLLKSDELERRNDEFVEAHIYEGFNYYSIQSMELASTARMTRVDRLDAEAATELFISRMAPSR